MRVGYSQIRLMRTTKETFRLSEFLVTGSALGLDLSKLSWVGNGWLDVNNTPGFPTDILKDMNEPLRDSSALLIHSLLWRMCFSWSDKLEAGLIGQLCMIDFNMMAKAAKSFVNTDTPFLIRKLLHSRKLKADMRYYNYITWIQPGYLRSKAQVPGIEPTLLPTAKVHWDEIAT